MCSVASFYKQGKQECQNSLTLSVDKIDNTDIFIPKDGMIHRRYTPLEYERLQMLDDNYTEGVSDTQRYRMVGNGWTISVIEFIFQHLLNTSKKD